MPLETNLERDTKVVQVTCQNLAHTLLLHPRTNKLPEINFKQLYALISSGVCLWVACVSLYTATATAITEKLIELFRNFVLLNLFFLVFSLCLYVSFSPACAYSCDPTTFNQNPSNHFNIKHLCYCYYDYNTTTVAASTGYKLHRCQHYTIHSTWICMLGLSTKFVSMNLSFCVGGTRCSYGFCSNRFNRRQQQFYAAFSSSKGNFCNNIKYELTATARQRPP